MQKPLLKLVKTRQQFFGFMKTRDSLLLAVGGDVGWTCRGVVFDLL